LHPNRHLLAIRGIQDLEKDGCFQCDYDRQGKFITTV